MLAEALVARPALPFGVAQVLGAGARPSHSLQKVGTFKPPSGAGPVEKVAALMPMIRAVIAKVTHLPLQHPDLDDCAAETLRRIVEGIGRVRSGEPVAPWAAGVARHVALDWLRARKRTRARTEDSTNEDLENEMVDSSPSPEQRTLEADQLRRVRAALDRLPEGPRAAVVAFHVDGLSYLEIADKLGVPMGTVATWIARSRQTLSQIIANERRDS